MTLRDVLEEYLKGKGKSVAKEKEEPVTIKQEDGKLLCDIRCWRLLLPVIMLTDDTINDDEVERPETYLHQAI